MFSSMCKQCGWQQRRHDLHVVYCVYTNDDKTCCIMNSTTTNSGLIKFVESFWSAVSKDAKSAHDECTAILQSCKLQCTPLKWGIGFPSTSLK